MGAVYLARDTLLGRRVAIKFLTHDNPGLAARFLAEARMTARCKHENIVDIYDAGETPGHSYMVLEYLQGVTLRTWLQDRWMQAARDVPASWSPGARSDDAHSSSNQPVSATLAAELIVPVVRALVHAHALGLVHRDLKPENIILADDGALKVLDFGVAKALRHLTGTSGAGVSGISTDPEATRQWVERGFKTRDGAVVGTAPYRSPEQWSAGEVDEHTDIWAVGIMLWELCTGHHALAPLTYERMVSVGLVDERIPSAQALLDELLPLLPGRGGVARDDHLSESDNPYVGLAAFQQEDAARFFGRDRDIAGMLAQLRNHRLVTITGGSGAGKSSLLRAGVIPALQRSGQPWESFIVRPGRQRLAALGDVLAQGTRNLGQSSDSMPAVGAEPAFSDTLRSQPGYLGSASRARCHMRGTRILLFVDQFEELYTLDTDRDTREAFVRCLEGVADDASSPLRVVLSVRSDFLDRVAEDRAFTSEITRAITLLSPLSREQLRQALTEPLLTTGYEFESEALIEEMLDTLEATRSPLPLLQFTAARLWDARDRDSQRITQKSYDAMGGIEGALATHADSVLTGLSSSEQRLARILFTNLVSDERTRAIFSLDELRASVGG